MTLRYGIMCNSTTFAAWEAACIEALQAVEGAELVVLIVNDEEDDPTPPAGMLRKVGKALTAEGAWTLYRRHAVNRRSRAMKRVDLAASLAGVPVRRCRVERKGRFSEYFRDDDLEALRAMKLDFVVRFGFGIVRGAVLEVPRYGVWSYHHDDLDHYRGRPPCFWEIYRGDPVTGAVLQRLTDRLDGGVVLKRGFFKTMMTSYALNRDLVYMGSVEWPAQVCTDILRGTAAYVDAAPSTTSAPIYYQPKRRQLARVVARTSWAYLCALLEPIVRTDRWNVGVIDRPAHTLLQETALPRVTWAPAEDRRRFVADPQAVDEVTFLAEEYDFDTGRGHIAAFELNGQGIVRRSVAIGGEAHLSYPYVVREGGRYYCFPEAIETGVLTRYVADGPPFEWRADGVAIDAPVVDPTPIWHDGRWWLFGTLGHAYSDTRLHIWFADTASSVWTPHPGNPVKCDVRSSRPAGTPFVHDGILYRPAQDCSRTYGGAIAINRVRMLTTEAFDEEVVTHLQPSPDSPYPHGVHTLVAWGERTLVDGKRRAFVPQASRQYIARKVFGRRKRSGKG